MLTNGPAIWGGCVTRRAPGRVLVFSQKTVTVQGGYGTCFCRLVQILLSIDECRGTSLIVARNLSRLADLVGTGAVSRYKLSRSHKSVTVQDFNCGQMSVSGCNNHYKFVLGAGAKAKTVTNNLPILSVLAADLFFIFNNHFNSSVFFTSRFIGISFNGRSIAISFCFSYILG